MIEAVCDAVQLVVLAVCLMALPLVGLAGSYATGGLAIPADADISLFGAASLFGLSPTSALAADNADSGNGTSLTIGTIAMDGTEEASGQSITAQANGEPLLVGNWAQLQFVTKFATDGTVIQLSNDLVCPTGKDRIEVEGGSNKMHYRHITINLNGHTLNRNLSSKTEAPTAQYAYKFIGWDDCSAWYHGCVCALPRVLCPLSTAATRRRGTPLACPRYFQDKEGACTREEKCISVRIRFRDEKPQDSV